MLEGVVIQPLKVFKDERGEVRHMLRADSELFKQFGEIYFSSVTPGHVKGWKKHLRMTQHFAVPVGNLKLVLFDDRPQASSKGQVQEISLGVDHYHLVRIPPGIWYSFASLDKTPAMIANCTDLPHDPQESLSRELEDATIPYNWDLSRL